jgi:hypothetical protein
MKKLSLLTIAVMMILTVGEVAQADGKDARRRGYQRHHYAPRSYRSHDRVIYRRGYPGPSRGYYPYGRRHYGQRTVYFSFFGLPIVTY